MQATRPSSSLVLALCMLLGASGCRTYHPIGVEQLRRLDGFRAGDRRVIADERGDPVSVTAESRFTFILVEDGEMEAVFASIDVSEGMLRGTLVDGGMIEIDLGSVEECEVSVFSPWRTARVISTTVVIVGLVFFVHVVVLGKDVGDL